MKCFWRKHGPGAYYGQNNPVAILIRYLSLKYNFGAQEIFVLLLFFSYYFNPSDALLAQNFSATMWRHVHQSVIPADFTVPTAYWWGLLISIVSTTMFIFPGVTVLKSYDLVKWEYAASPCAVRFQSCYNLEAVTDKSRTMGHSFRYHNGTFICCLYPGWRRFLCSATQAEGTGVSELPKVFTIQAFFWWWRGNLCCSRVRWTALPRWMKILLGRRDSWYTRVIFARTWRTNVYR